MNKNRMTKPTVPGERARNREAISINGTCGKSGGRASKAVELITGDLRCVTAS
jgi:hypothetical protein